MNGTIPISDWNYTLISIYDEYYINKKNDSFINYIDKHTNLIEKVLKETIEKLLQADNNYEIYPIMRNWSVVDVYNISKNLLFTSTKSNDVMTQTAITTDSTYLYILLFGICGGLYKIGTGKNGSIKGKVYNQNLSLNSNEGNPMLVYVKSTNKLYLKTNQSHFGNIKIINTENLTIESIKLLNFPQNVKSTNIYEKNMNYVLLSDDYNLYALVLLPVPSFPKAAMDGYAVKAEETDGASPEKPVRLTVMGESLAGKPWKSSTALLRGSTEPQKENAEKDSTGTAIEKAGASETTGTAVRIMTGAEVPRGYDAVVRQEDTDYGTEAVEIYKGVTAYTNYCKVGEDIREGQDLLLAGRRIGRIEAGVLASLGMAEVKVRRPLRITILRPPESPGRYP